MRTGIRAATRAAVLAAVAAVFVSAPVLPVVARAEPDGPPAAASDALTPWPSPAGPGSLAPQLAVSPDGRLFLSWLEPADAGVVRFRVAEWRAGAWDTRADVIASAGLFANWADVPSVFASRDGRLVAHYLEKTGAGTFAYGIRLRVSTDAGRTWSAPLSPHRDESPSEHGFLSFFEAAGGAIGMVWLDGRETAAASGAPSGGHGHGGAGAMTLRATTLDISGAAGPVLGPDTLIDSRVCDCCPTAAIRTPGGALVAYRDRSEHEVRDISIARLDGGRWVPGGSVHADGWEIPGCPVNGPALSAAGGSVALAWFTAAGDQGRALVAWSRDEGATFGQPVRVDGGEAIGRVDVETLADGSVVVLWIEFAGGKADLRLRRFWPDGRAGAPLVIAPVGADRSSGYPRLAQHDGRLVVAWRAPGTPAAIRIVGVAASSGSGRNLK